MQARASVAINSNETVMAAEARAQLVAPVAAQTVAVREVSLHQITKRLSLGALGQAARRNSDKVAVERKRQWNACGFLRSQQEGTRQAGPCNQNHRSENTQEKQQKAWTAP